MYRCALQPYQRRAYKGHGYKLDYNCGHRGAVRGRQEKVAVDGRVHGHVDLRLMLRCCAVASAAAAADARHCMRVSCTRVAAYIVVATNSSSNCQFQITNNINIQISKSDAFSDLSDTAPVL